MCHQLGMNCNTPTDILFSFDGFRRRGGLTDHHADGFGIAFFEHAGCRVFLDYEASAHSSVADFVHRYPIKSTHVIAHIRKATQGRVALENTHPFQREMWGQNWIFAHNGNLVDFAPPRGQFYRPVGDTDSEAAFCMLLERLRQQFDDAPPAQTLHRAVSDIAAEIREAGIFNFMLSNGQVLFTHCTTHLHYIVRQAPFAVAHLVDNDVSVDFSTVTTPNDRVAVIATQPLTDNECWTTHPKDTVLMFSEGWPHLLETCC